MPTRTSRTSVVGLITLFVLATVSAPAMAQPLVQKIRQVHAHQQIGLNYTVRTANWGDYLAVERTQPGFGAAEAGLEPGDLISRINNQRVTGPQTLQAAIQASPDIARFQVLDVRTNQWVWVNVRVRQILGPFPDPNQPNQPPQPPQPGPGNGNGGPGNGGPGNGGPGNGGPMNDLAGQWRSNLGGTIQFFPGPAGGFAAVSNVPFFGRSDLFCTTNFDQSISFTYQQRNGARDSGNGLLRPVGPNRLQGYFINRLGMRVDFVLTR